MSDIWGNFRRVQTAVREAKAFAEEKKVPLTIERLAAFLGVSRMELLEELERKEGDDEIGREKARALLRRTCAEAVASVVEFGLLKGNTPTMTMFYLKSNAGYRERMEKERPPDICFYGEEELE
ncbi:MAG: hypothetical protein HFJ80_07725 [Clostridiales bacterium]|nr:hypothetical protein [Clostridiales bacterium]